MDSGIQLRLEEVAQKWNALSMVPEDLTGWGFPGLTKASLGHAISGMAKLAKTLADDDAYTPDALERFELEPLLVNLLAYVNQHIPSNPQPHVIGLINVASQIRRILIGWVESTDHKGKKYVGKFAQQLAEASSKLAEAEVTYKSVVDTHALISTSSDEIAEYHKEIEATAELVEQKQIVASKNAVELEVLETKLRKLSEDVQAESERAKKLNSEIEVDRSNQKALFDELNGQRHVVDSLLADSNRSGMAAAFKTRKDELIWPLRFWAFAFSASVGGLLFIAWQYFSSISGANWLDALVRLPLSGALIWLGWFAAKQYGYTRRLQEDYSYKVASAMSFEGYKREAANIDAELLKRLMETAIVNLSENPLRVYQGESNHASPANELLEKLLKDQSFVDLLKNYTTKH